MLKNIVAIAVCLVSSACSVAQLNSTSSDLATSLNTLTRKQIFYNLAQAFTDAQFVPSQVTVASGNAHTTNSIQPTLTVPFVTSYQATNTFGSISGGGAGTLANQSSLAGPGLSLQANQGWDQSWTMSPLSDANQIGRLRELYKFVVSQPKQDAGAISADAKSHQLICDYPYQAFAIALDIAGQGEKPAQTDSQKKSPPSSAAVFFNRPAVPGVPKPPPAAAAPPPKYMDSGAIAKAVEGGKAYVVGVDNGNAIIAVKCRVDSDSERVGLESEIVFRHADPTFLVGPNCVICIRPNNLAPLGFFDYNPVEKAKAKSMEVIVNPRLVSSFISTESVNKSSVPIGAFSSLAGSMSFYATVQPPLSAERAFSDFILMTYEAMGQTGNGANGKESGTSNYVLSLPR
jgi:hypothetical protein